MQRRYTGSFTIFIKLTALLAVACMLFCSCSREEDIIDILDPSIASNASEMPLPDTDTEAQKDLIHYNLPKIEDMHPLDSHSIEVDNLFSLIFDRALVQNSDGSFSGGVIESWNIEDDGKLYTFNIRSGISFHDETLGTVTAYDIEYALNYIMDETHTEAYNHAMAEGIEEITVKSTTSITVKLSSKKHDMLSLMNFFVVPKAYYQGETSRTRKTPVGTGAYTVKTFEKDYYILLQRNESYWKKLPVFGQIEVIPVDDKEVKLGSDIFNDVEMIFSTSFTSGSLGKTGRTTLNQIRTDNLYCLLMNVYNDNLSKKNIRKAISYGIDRTDIVRESMMGLGEMTYTPLVETYYGITNRIEGLYSQNIKESYQLLKREGYYIEEMEEGEYIFTLRLAYEASPASYDLNKMIAQEIRKSLENLHIKVELVGFAGQEEFEKALSGGNFHLALCQYRIGPDYDLSDLFSGIKGHYSNSKLNDALKRCRTATTDEEVKEAYTAVHDILVDDMPVIGLFFEEYSLITSYDITVPEKLVNGNIFSNISEWGYKGK